MFLYVEKKLFNEMHSKHLLAKRFICKSFANTVKANIFAYVFLYHIPSSCWLECVRLGLSPVNFHQLQMRFIWCDILNNFVKSPNYVYNERTTMLSIGKYRPNYFIGSMHSSKLVCKFIQSVISELH